MQIKDNDDKNWKKGIDAEIIVLRKAYSIVSAVKLSFSTFVLRKHDFYIRDNITEMWFTGIHCWDY